MSITFSVDHEKASDKEDGSDTMMVSYVHIHAVDEVEIFIDA